MDRTHRLRLMALLPVTVAGALVAVGPGPASAESPARERELVCSDGTTFTAIQVRQGGGPPPSVWRGVESGEPRLFVFLANTVTAPDGTVVEALTYDHTAGVDHGEDLVTCGFVIPIGPLTGYQADFTGFFVP